MKKNIIISPILIAVSVACAHAQLNGIDNFGFGSLSEAPITVQPEKSSGLNSIFVLYDVSGASMQFSSSEDVRVHTFSNLGAAYSEEVNIIKSENNYTVDNLIGNRGYVIETSASTNYIWIVDYASFESDIQNIAIAPDSDCSTVTLDITGGVAQISCYSINGRKIDIDRDIELQYNTLDYDDESGIYTESRHTDKLDHVGTHLYVDAPLCNTDFTITGDRFLKEWKLPVFSHTSPYYYTTAVAAHTSARQDMRNVDNEQTDGTDGLGGSAPCSIEFHAAVTDAVIFKEWQMSRDPEFNDIFYRNNNLDFDFVFQEEGTTYVRFTASNEAATCDYYGPSYEVSIGDSQLICPNAFSPGASEGVNDVWKVSFKSLVDFDCHIFNRWGIQVAHFSNPADGWDGKYNGKYVPAGVYYYVIKARGADGKSYSLKGDINIITQKKRVGTNQSPSHE